MITSYDQALAVARQSEERRVMVELEAAHAVVQLHDPDKLNALSLELTVQLQDELRRVVDDEAVRCIVLTGTDPAFSAGGDLNLMQNVLHPMVDAGTGGATSTWRWITGQFGSIVRLITGCNKPVIAALNGAAAGVGLAFALSCDLIIASQQAQLVPAFGRIGLVPESGLSWLLTRRLGYQRAFELFTEGRHLSGEEAAELGLANTVVQHDELLPTALEWCERIERMPAHAPALTKRMLRTAADMTWEQAIVMEEMAMPMCFTTTAHREAVTGWFDR